MTKLVIALLIGLACWLAVKLDAANRHNAELRARVESLRRQLVRMR